MKKVLIVGLGQQMIKDHIPSIKKRNDIKIAALVEPNNIIAKSIAKGLQIPYYSDISDVNNLNDFDLAIVSVPHNQYTLILELLAKNHISTLKEKPFAMNLKEAQNILKLFEDNNTYLQICVQRRFSKLYDTAKSLLIEIGKIYSMYVEYTLNLPSMSPSVCGWRSDIKIAGGGATLDLGYHTIDLLTYLFGLPDKIYAQLNYNSLANDYTVDDSMKAMMTYNQGQINGNILTTEVFLRKGERIRIFGVKGAVYIDNRKTTLYDRELNELETHIFSTKDSEVDSQLQYFVEQSGNFKSNKLLRDQISNMRIIDAIYHSGLTGKVIKFK